MADGFRNTGIQVIGDAPWGTHFCQFYQTKEDLIEILVPYFKAGLENNEFCVWITAEPLGVEEAKASLKKAAPNLDDYIKKGQIEILEAGQWYTKSGKFDPEAVLQGWVRKEDQAFERGFEGLRLTGNTFWLEKADWRDFAEYEQQVNKVIGRHRMIALCSYCLDKCSASEIIDVVQSHQFALIRRAGEWELIESSERTLAGEALKAEREFTEKALNTQTDSFFVFEPSTGRAVRWNKAFNRISGYSDEEIRSMKAPDSYYSEKDLKKAAAATEKVLSEGTATVELSLITKDGRSIPTEYTGSAIRDEKGDPKYIIAVGRNITERKQAEEKLRESEKRYREFTDSLPQIVFETDVKGNLTFVNLRALGNYGYSREDLDKGLNVLELVIPEHRERVKKSIVKGFSGEELTGEEYTALRKDGSTFPIVAHSKPITRGNRVVGLRGIVVDISERKRSEERFIETNKLLETLLDHTHMLVAYLDPQFNFLKVNRAYAEADGREPSFFPGKNHFHLYPNVENEKIFQRVVKTGEPHFAYAKPFEYAEHPERGVTYWDWSLIPIKDPMGAVTGLVLTLVDVTERERAEKALRESEERLRSFMDSATDAFVLWDKDLNLVEFNEAALKTFGPGTKKTEVTGKNILKLVPTLKQTGRYERYLEVIRTAKPFYVDDVILDPEFGERRVSVTAFKVGDGLGMVVTDVTERKLAEEALRKARDELEIRVDERTRELSAANIELQQEIAERKHAEESLRASREDYRTLVETSRDMIFTVDLNGAFLFTNRAFEEILGYSSKEIRKINGFELVHPEYSESVRKQFARLVQGESVDNMEYRYKRKDGSYISILNNASPIFDADGKVVAAFGVARDITERKKAEKALQESELWMRNMFNSLEEAVFVVTPDRTLVNINEAAKRMFGYEKHELVDLSTEVLHVDHEHYVEFGRRIREAFDRKQAASFEFEAKRKNGEVFPTEHTVTLLKNDVGESLGIVSVVRDVTERRRAERELNQYREHLEELAEERTAELKRTNERLEREVTERKQAEKGLEWELAVNRELARLSGALIARSSSIPDIANIVLDSAKSLTDSEHGFVSSIDAKTGDAVAHTLTQMMGKECLVSGQDRRIVFPKSSDGRYPKLWGHALNSREAFFSNSPDTHEASGGTPHGHIPLTNFLAVPAIVGEELVGQIAVANSAGDYTDRHLEAVRRLAEMYALAIQHGRAEEALRESEERFRTSFDNANTGMCLVDPKGTLIKVNQRMCEIFGYGKEELEGVSVNDITHPDDRDISPDFIRRSIAGEVEGQDFEKRYFHKQGHVVWGLVSSSLVRDSGGNPLYFISQVQDITERKLAEEELRKRTYDLNKRVKELNCLYNMARLIETAGMSLEGIFQGAVDLIPAASQYPEITCARLVLGDRIFATSNFTETRWRLASDVTVRGRREGSLEVYYLEERPERDEGPFLTEERNLLNTVVERLGRVIERKRAEGEIRKLNTSLEMQAAELAASNKELEAFSYSVSHDLRAPLRTVDGFSRALLEDYPDKLDERGKDYLTRIRTATQRMGHLIDDLLNLSMMMRKEMRREQIDLSEMAHSIAGELKKTQPERQVQFVIPDGVLAHGDASLLREVLENLLRNAWKFTSKHARARIEFGVTHKNDEKVYFVRDDGAGFDMNYAEKLFAPFQRLHSVGEFSGNGVGLAVVSRIINRHGGRVWAEGEVEKGATFYFTLP